MKTKAFIASFLIAISLGFTGEKKVDCSNPGSTYESLACANLKHDSADKKLNAVFKKTKSEMSKAQVKLLIAAQKGWLQLRDNQCSLETYADQGTGKNERYIDCLTEFTELRTKQLESTPTDSAQE